MKYIRTKDRVVEFNIIRKLNETTYEIEGIKDHYVHKEEIIAQADTIEELCDKFVVIIPTEKPDFVIDFAKNRQTFVMAELDVYGAIWTEWGLKYVARMNSKGVLELL